jgi:hypothetical protein
MFGASTQTITGLWTFDANLTLGADIIPDGVGRDLGSTGTRFQNVYTDDLTVTNAVSADTANADRLDFNEQDAPLLSNPTAGKGTFVLDQNDNKWKTKVANEGNTLQTLITSLADGLTTATLMSMLFDEGAPGTYLNGNGTWTTPAGSGDITAVGPGFASGDAFTDGVVSTGTTMFVWEGTTNDANELNVISPSADPGADIDITLPGSSGTLLISGGDVGAATATTPTAGDNDTSVATTAFVQRTQRIYVNVGAMIPRTTNGAEASTTELSNGIMFDSLLFDPATEEGAGFWVTLPDSWDGGTITAAFSWTGAAGAGDVVWGLSGISLGNDDAMDVAPPASTNTTDTFLAANDMHLVTSAAITVSNAVVGEPIYFQVKRIAADAGDTKAEDAQLLGITLNFE